MELNKFNIDLSSRIKAYQDNILKENKFHDVVGNTNRSTKGGNLGNKYVQPTGNVAAPDPFLIKGSLDGGKINRHKKAKRWMEFSGETGKMGIDLADQAVGVYKKHDTKSQLIKKGLDNLGGGKISRIKKATKWRDFSVDTVSKGIGLTDKALSVKDKHDPKSRALKKVLGSGIPKKPTNKRIQTAIKKLESHRSGTSKLKPTKLQMQLLEDVGILEKTSGGCAAKKAKVTGGAKKAPSAWISHVQSYWKANGGTYRDAMKAAKSSYKK
jgi:hypothetical protein